MSPSALEIAAHELVTLGFSVFPLKPCEKVPATANGCKDATLSHEQVTAWWTRHPGANVGIATGHPFVVDVDGAEGETTLQARFGTMPLTLEVLTGRGRHLYFALPDGVTLGNSAGRLGPKLDTRGTGGYVVAPPSLHPSGSVYRWAPDRSPDECDLAVLPDALLAALQPVHDTRRTTHTPVPFLAPTQPHERSALLQFRAWMRTVDTGLADGQGRNQTAYRIARRALEAMPLADVQQVVAAWNSANRPPLDDRELTMVIHSAAGIRRARTAA